MWRTTLDRLHNAGVAFRRYDGLSGTQIHLADPDGHLLIVNATTGMSEGT